jgi:aminoglycoside phosphotransferase (APT) family kinase protein
MAADSGPDAGLIAVWLAGVVDSSVSGVAVARIGGGFSSGAWRVEADTRGGPLTVVMKAPGEPSVVYRRDACREARILDALHRHGAPVPEVLAIDDATVTGRRCFAMEHVAGRAIADNPPGGPHEDPWLRGAGAEAQRAVWNSFHDALAALHMADSEQVPDASHGPRGVADVLAYWREALLDAAPAEAVPRQLAALDWLRANVPPGADDAPAVCMGDARLANCMVVGTEVRALIDFEVAYTGNPAADIGYSLLFDAAQRRGAAAPLEGFPSAEETWDRWSRVTGRPAVDRDYWTAFGAMIACVTATRARIQWGLAGPAADSRIPFLPQWESAITKAAR